MRFSASAAMATSVACRPWEHAESWGAITPRRAAPLRRARAGSPDGVAGRHPQKLDTAAAEAGLRAMARALELRLHLRRLDRELWHGET